DQSGNRIRKVSAANQVITTVAGNGTSTFSYEGASAFGAGFTPSGVAVDGAGNLYIADTKSYKILKVDVGPGVIHTVAGNGTAFFQTLLGQPGEGKNATAVGFFPSGIAVDGVGNLYIADANNSRVFQVLAASQVITTFAHAGSDRRPFFGDGELANVYGDVSPAAVAVDVVGNVYIADLNNRIRRVDAATGIINTVAGPGRISQTWPKPDAVGYSGDGNAATSASLGDLTSVAVGAGIYFIDSGRVRKVSPLLLSSSNGSIVYGSTVSLTVTGGSGLGAVSYALTTGAQNCSINGNVLTATGIGLCTVLATKASDGNYLAATSQPLVIVTDPAPQSVAFDSLSNVVFGAQPISLAATASSGLTVSFAATTQIVCTVTGTVVTVVAVGVCSITASQTGNATFIPYTVTSTFNVTPAVQAITFSELSNVVYGSGFIWVTATVSSGLPVSFVSTTLDKCTISGNTVTIVAPGTCTIRASQAGNNNYAAAPPVSQSFVIIAANQTITFGALNNLPVGGQPALMSATATSGLAVAFSTPTPAVCSVTGATVTVISVGTCSVMASQVGNTYYRPAAPVIHSFAVMQSSQTITFGPFSDIALGSLPWPLAATASSGLAVNVASITPAICTLSGATLTLVSTGTCSITASQDGNDNYSAAPAISRSFVVTRAAQSIDAGTAGLQTFAGNGTVGFSGDGGAAINASFNYPGGLALDSTGNLYIADLFNNVVRKVTVATGLISRVAGNGTRGFSGDGGAATSAALSSPEGIAVDYAGNLYMADNQRIRRVSAATGLINTIAGNGDAAFSGDGGPAALAALYYPKGLAVDSAGNLYIADSGHHRIRKITVATGIINTVAGGGSDGDGGAATSASLSWPQSVVVDGVGNLYIADASQSRIRRVAAATGLINTVAGTGTKGVSRDGGVAINIDISASQLSLDGNGNLYFDSYLGVQKISPLLLTSAKASLFPGNSVSLTTAGGSGTGAVTYAITAGAQYCSLDGNVLTATGVCVVIATKAGDTNYLPATSLGLTVFAGQDITFPALGDTALASGAVTLNSSASSGLAVSLSSATPAMCTVAGFVVTLVSAGTCSITASQTGNSTYGAATPVLRSFAVTQTSQTISFAALSDRLFGTGPVNLSAIASSGLVISFDSSTQSVCNVTGSSVSLLAIGKCSITATQEGNLTYARAPSVTQSFNIALGSQLISFDSLSNNVFGGGPIPLSATASSALAVSFASTTQPVCTVSASMITIVTVGTCSITASQLGDSNYAAATPVSQHFIVSQSSQTITFGVQGNVVFGSGPLTLAATASSGLSVSFASSTSSVCTVSGSTVTIVAGGTCSINATQAGSVGYAAALPATLSVTVTPSNQTSSAGTAGIQTIAGNGTMGFSGDGGLATSAMMWPGGTALDGAGNLYIADTGNHRIRKVSAVTGVITTVAGNGTVGFSGDGGAATNAGLDPATVAVDGAGNLYIVDQSGNRIRKVSAANQVITTVAGNGTNGFSGDGGTATSAALLHVSSVAVDSAGNIYTADGNSRIRRISAATGVITTVAGNGTSGFSGDGGSATSAALAAPFWVTLDGTGNLYISDLGNSRIRKVSAATGVITTVAGNGTAGFSGDGMAATTAALSGPSKVTVDGAGNLYITDSNNRRIRKVSPLLLISSAAGLVNGAAAYLSTSGGSGSGAVTYAITAGGERCSISGNMLTATAAGSCVITAMKAGDADYLPATSQNLTVFTGLSAQTLSFQPLSNLSLGYPQVSLVALTSSSLPVSFASTTPGVCTVSGSDLFLVSSGLCSIIASQSGNERYAAVAVTQSIVVTGVSQAISFTQPSAVIFGSGPVALSATASSVLPVSFASSTQSVCTVSGTTVTLVSAGSCSITASQAGNGNYAAAPPVTQSFNVTQAAQTITFTQPAAVALGSGSVTLSATANSGLTVSFASTTTPVCTVSGTAVTLVSMGACAITASQAGSANYAAAAPVTQTFTVTGTAQTITFTQPASVVFGSGPVTLSATANSGLTVSFASTTTSVCTVSGTTATLVSTGTCSITATQTGNGSYAAASPVTQSFTIVGTAQIITFGSRSNVSLGVGSASLTATASSGLPVSLASTTSSVCTVNGSTVTLVSAGSCSITASQAGNGTYAAATPVTQSFTVNPTSQILTFNSLPGVIYGVSPFNLTATASSGLAVAFASTSPIVCTVWADSVTVVAPGTCSITASQSGNGNYLAAANVVQSFTISSPANSVSLLVGDGSGLAGQTVEVGIQLTSSGTANPGGFQLDLSYDATKLAYVSARIGAQATAADKSVSVQTQQNGDVRLLGVGFNQNVIANGIVAYATFRLNALFTSGSTLVTPKNCTATDPSGFGLVSPCTAGTIRPNTCDINTSGGVNVADVQLIINEALGIIPATHDLNRDSRVNVADVQLVINAALGLGCNLP
ncbi:MAG: hypothetical protein EBY17_25510, partial [Acidobacteriia bacterium]|nr:hypothetical protein [Terriglobia bacterium]